MFGEGVDTAYRCQGDEPLVESERLFHHELFTARKWKNGVVARYNWRTQLVVQCVTVGMGSVDRPLDEPSRVFGSLPEVNAISPGVRKNFLRETRKVAIDERQRHPLSVTQHKLPCLASGQANGGRERVSG